MSVRVVAAVLGLLGGACWVAAAVADQAALHWAGLALLALSLAAAGTQLVSRSAGWLRAIVAVAFPLLAWSVLEVVRDAVDADPVVDGVVGGAAAVIAVTALVRGRAASRGKAASDGAPVPAQSRPGSRRATRRDRGSHAL